MKLHKLATAFLPVALGLNALTSCEGGDIFGIDAPDWISSVADSIAASKVVETLDLPEDVYTIGATDYSSGWWAEFSRYYQIPEGETWVAQFYLGINPDAANTYKNFALLITNDCARTDAGYVEYGAIRYDYQPSGNSEWGDYLDRSYATSNLEFSTDTDDGVSQLGGTVTLTVDRSEGGLNVTITNGTITKTYLQSTALPNLNEDLTNTNIRCFLCVEGSYINFLGSSIEPIGGYTSKEDKQPVALTLNSVPKKVLVGTAIEDAFKNITATVEFEQSVTKTVSYSDLVISAVPNMTSTGTKTLVAAYSKTTNGAAASAPVIGTAQFEVVDKMYESVGSTDNSTAFWGAHSDYVQVEPGETAISTFTNYSSGASNWNNFVVVLTNASAGEYAVVRADNYGWGDGYGTCTTVCENGDDWATWLAAMDGAKVTTYVTNNGDGTADVKAVIEGTDGNTYKQEYNGITIDSSDFYYHFTVDGSHIEFDQVLGEEDNTTGWWTAHSDMVQVPVGKTGSARFTNYTSGAANWNNFLVVVTRADNSEYAVLRADNYGWGDQYGSADCDNGGDWTTWLAAMDEAEVTVKVTNNGGSVDVHCVMIGNDGRTFTQDYTGISPTDGDDVYFRFTTEGGHLVFK